MARFSGVRNALRVTWNFPAADAASARTLHRNLFAGHERLFELRSWDFRDGQAWAILKPKAPLEDIVAMIWGLGHQPAALSLTSLPVRARIPRHV